MLVSTFQVFIALGSVLGGQVVDAFGSSTVMWASGAVSMLGLIVVSLSRHVPQPVPTEGQVHLV